jgi:uncharacterized protein (TIGR02271 family)
MKDRVTIDQLTESRGATVYSSDGEKIGSVEEIFYDEQTRQPEWIGVGTGIFKTKRVLVPVAGARVRGDRVDVHYAKDHVKDSPDIDSDEISEQTERELYSYYGIEASKRRSDTVLPEGRRDVGAQQVTRKEEEVEVGKRGVEAGRARLRKWVETEPVEMDVALERERARVTREQVDEPVSDHDFAEEEVEVPLRAEEPVVGKRTVAKERVGLDKDVETEQRTVSEEVRKERVDVEGDVERR